MHTSQIKLAFSGLATISIAQWSTLTSATGWNSTGTPSKFLSHPIGNVSIISAYNNVVVTDLITKTTTVPCTTSSTNNSSISVLSSTAGSALITITLSALGATLTTKVMPSSTSV